jgi:hypothetical protein
MKLCPHCANPIDEDVRICPFCKGSVERRGWVLQGTGEKADSVPSREAEEEKKGSVLKMIVYLLVVVVVVIGAFLAGWLVPKSERGSGLTAPSLEGQGQETREKNRQIEQLDSQIAQLRKELEGSSTEAAELRARLEKTDRALSSAQERSKSVSREGRGSTSPGQPAGGTARAEPVPAGVGQKTAEPGSYEVIRTTTVFEGPSDSFRRVATITQGTRVNIVGSAGDWLEVRSKRGNPPGFINREDAMFVESAK